MTVNKMEQFASGHPVIFGFVITIVFVLMLVASAVLGALWPGEETYGQPGVILGRLISTAVLLAALYRLGWLGPAGFTSPGGWRAWLSIPLPLAYSIGASAYAMTGNIDLRTTSPAPTGLVTLFILTAAFMEEVTFRGLILHALVRAWGSKNRGLMQSVLVSSLFFSSIHLLDALSGRPLPNVFLQSLQAVFLGIFLGTLVMRGKSIYPAAFFHASLNLAGYLIFGSRGVEPATTSWLLQCLLMLPLALYGVYLLRGVPHRPIVLKAA